MLPQIAVVGGYGSIGREIAARLAASGRCRVLVAGRDGRAAEAQAQALGSAATGGALDVLSHDPSPLVGSRIVVNATAPSWRTSRPAARLALAAGADVVDIGGYDLLMQALAGEADAIAAAGRRVVVSAGWMPGLSEVLARRVGEMAGRGTRIRRMEILCGARDHWSEGSAADMLWHLLERSAPGWYERGRWRAVSQLGAWAVRRLPWPIDRQIVRAVPNPQAAGLASELRPGRLTTFLGLVGWRTTVAMARARMIGRRDPDGAARLLARAISDEAGRQPIGFCEVRAAAAHGSVVGRIVTSNNLRLTAAATAEAALALLAQPAVPAGVRYLGDAVQARPFLDAIRGSGVACEMVVG